MGVDKVIMQGKLIVVAYTLRNIIFLDRRQCWLNDFKPLVLTKEKRKKKICI